MEQTSTATTAFDKALATEYGDDTRLGMPARDKAHGLRRLAAMERMTGGKGFRTPAKEPRTDANGLTRGQRKRKMRAIAMDRVSEDRAPEYMHSAARMRAGLQAAPKPMTGFLATMKEAA